MMRSLFSGVTGLRSHQTRMDVIGNNIANVNTVGFKKSTVTFKDLYSETISAAASASGVGAGTTGGVNPKQIGLGSAVNSVSVVHTPGSAQYTGNGMDVAISGDGYFVVQTPTGNMYTRAGNFYTDQAGNLVTADGYYVQTVAPNQKAAMMYSLNSVQDDTMKNQIGGIDAPAGGVIRTGKVTADLAEAMGKTYHFAFTPADEEWTATMNGSSFVPKGTDKVGVTSGGWLNTAIQDKVVAAAEADPDGAYAGTLKMKFAVDPADNTKINLMVGNMVIGSHTLAAAIDDATPVTMDFGGGLTFSVTNLDADPATNTLDAKGVVDALQSASSLPTVALKQNGEWSMLDNEGTVVDKVTVSATAAAGGGYQGDFTISTTEFGNFTLTISGNEVVTNNNVLSDKLAGSSFSLDVTSEWGVEYSSPGQVLESELNTLNIDFDMYSSLAIDSKGAVVAQLKQDQQVTVDGQTITLKAGSKVVLGYVALANFNNPTGLEKVGDNLYSVSANSGDPTFNMPGSGSAGQLSPSNLEMSNVDLSEEIVNMIITQRGFQANSRIITTTDTMLEELVNLKR